MNVDLIDVLLGFYIIIKSPLNFAFFLELKVPSNNIFIFQKQVKTLISCLFRIDFNFKFDYLATKKVIVVL